eukprot:1154050-Pelagomonas_calceolata.AAC.5
MLYWFSKPKEVLQRQGSGIPSTNQFPYEKSYTGLANPDKPGRYKEAKRDPRTIAQYAYRTTGYAVPYHLYPYPYWYVIRQAWQAWQAGQGVDHTSEQMVTVQVISKVI